MPFAEQSEGSGHREEPKKEQEAIPYYLASRFGGERVAGQVYFQAQDLIFNTPDCEVSVYRFQLDRIYHVAVLGDKPEEQLETKLKDILSKGEFTPLPSMVLKTLVTRRQQHTRHSPWIEKHYRPGKPMD